MSKGWTCPECDTTKKRKMPTKTQKRPLVSQNETVSDDELSTTTDTIATDKNASFLSLPDLTTENSEEISGLQTEILELKSRLESANAEIDRLSSENTVLKNLVNP